MNAQYPRFDIETYRPNGVLLGRRTVTVTGNIRSALAGAYGDAIRECRNAHGFTPTVRIVDVSDIAGRGRQDVTRLWAP